MFKITSIVILSCVFSLLYSSPVFATEDFTFSINSLSEFEVGQFPFVNGIARTLDNNPVPNVQIQVHFPSGIVKTTTNSTGQFSASSPVPANIGEYTITVYAKKDNKHADTLITYKGVASKPKLELQIEKIPKTNEKIELDPFSKMLKDIEKQRMDDVKRKSNVQTQHQVDEQRRLAQIDLESDLKESEKRNESNSPRNAFYRFLQEVDNSVRGIFWQQFLFTEKITNQAKEAKENALDEGKSSFEAMKIFQKEAAVTQQEVIEFNKNLSVNYGNSTSDIQDQFDENGKLPREE
ncbi:MAG: carboxypeptidase-like regulatory domain-containing protein [Nitrosopumilus sp.]|nr:carboxypeptidase-like regulatory domain-containing protein [Nitrosopumilus sp.]